MELPVETNDITVQILRDIRDAIVQTNTRLGETNTRLDQLNSGQLQLATEVQQTNSRLDQTNSRLDHLYSGQLQLATEVYAMGGTLGDIRELFVGRRDLRHRVERCEREIAAIKQRIP